MPIRYAVFAGLLFPLSFVSAQTVIIPQIADGGGWQTTLVLTNTATTSTSVSLSFFQSIANGGTQSWSPSFLETSSLQNFALPAASTVFLHTPGTAATLTEGWAEFQANSSVVAYAIFTQIVPGRPNQDGTAQAASASSRVLVPFNNSSGLVTSIAIANPTSTSETISVGVQATSGSAAQLSSITLPANGYMAFTVPQLYSATSGENGLLEFYSASGSFSMIALRFNASGGFTSSPVYAETGPPIIGGGTASTYNGTYSGTYTSTAQSGPVTATINSGTVTISSPAAGTGTVTTNGQVAFGVVEAGGISCNFTGSIVVTGSGATASGTFSCPSVGVSGTWNLTRQ